MNRVTRHVRQTITKWRAVSAVAAMVGATAVGLVAGAPSSQGITPGLTGYQVIAGPTTMLDGPMGFSGDVSCPAGQTAISAGVNAHSPLVQIVSMYPASATDWTFDVVQRQTVGYQQSVTLYVVCVDTSSVPGFALAGPSPTTVNANSVNIVDTFCPNGDYVLGGGFQNSLPEAYGSISRWVDNDTRAWQAAAWNPDSVSETLSAYATCVPQADVSDYAQTAGDMNSFGAFFDQTAGVTSPDKYGTTGSPYCPNGDLATGGGAINHDYTTGNAWISSLIPDVQGDPHYWLETSNDANPPSYGEWAAAYAVCANGTLAPISTTTTLAISPTPVAFNASETLTATVTPASGTAPTGTVTFFDNGTPLGTSPLSGGVATLTWRFGAGPHSLVAVYNPDPGWSTSQSTPLTFSISCTTTITGTHGAFTASSGLTCVTGATITGGVTVVGGAQVDFENSTIRGGVTLSGSGAARFCHSTMSSLTVAAANGYVMVGDPSSGCSGNVINGGVSIASNKGGGSLINNKITGAIAVTNNTPAWTVSGNHS